MFDKELLCIMAAIIDAGDQVASAASKTCMDSVDVVDRAVLLLVEVKTRLNREGYGGLKEGPSKPHA